MSKQDIAEPPAAPPRKRRHLQDPNITPDAWLAVWRHAPGLTDHERRQVQIEHDRRKALRRDRTVCAVIVAGPEGMTPAQRVAALGAVPAGATLRIVRAGDKIDRAGLLICCPRETRMPHNVAASARSSVWETVRAARYRRIPTRIILPDGEEGTF